MQTLESITNPITSAWYKDPKNVFHRVKLPLIPGCNGTRQSSGPFSNIPYYCVTCDAWLDNFAFEEGLCKKERSREHDVYGLVYPTHLSCPKLCSIPTIKSVQSCPENSPSQSCISCNALMETDLSDVELCNWDDTLRNNDPYNIKSRCGKACNVSCYPGQYRSTYSMTLCPLRTEWNWQDNTKIRCLPIQCKKGQQISENGRTCVDCEIGFYKDKIGPENCVTCPRNTYGTQNGATSLDRCLQCSPNS
jgi:hypothetical protein